MCAGDSLLHHTTGGGELISILIKGMEMPKEGYVDVRIKCNGTASFAIADNPYFKAVEAVPVPPHGDLIGREWLIDIALHLMNTAKNDDIANGVKWLLQYIIEAPAIIPAEPAEEDET